MHREPVAFGIDAGVAQLLNRIAAVSVDDGKRKLQAQRTCANRRDEVELTLNFVTHALVRLDFAYPVGQQLIRILAAVRKPKWYAREVAEHRRSKRTLAVDGEN